jgi:hypothetical protein
VTLCGHRGRETDRNRVAAEVYGAGNNARQQRPGTRCYGRKKSETRVAAEKLGEAEGLFVLFLLILVRRVLRKIVAVYVPLFLPFFNEQKLGLGLAPDHRNGLRSGSAPRAVMRARARP